ncbi:EamA family transporter [Candidatus Lokiarchaeum ossiferum]|uniref:EamA family transporter n=1 Tax=Candidatus Lokiarchaeum ossiferum TaxID=2951803 RepID=UPI00352C00EF
MVFNWYILLIMVGYAFFNGIGSLGFKLGLKKIDKSSVSLQNLSKENRSAYIQLLKTPIWLFGWLCLGIDFLIYQIAIKNYDLSVIKPLVNLNLIFVILFGTIILKEKIGLFEWIGITFIILGAIMITLYSTPSETNINLPKLIIFIGLILISVVLLVIANQFTSIDKKELILGCFSGILYGTGSIFNKAAYSTNNSYFLTTVFIIFFGISYGFAFLSGQSAYLNGRMSIVSTLVNVFSILTPFIGGILIFEETLILDTPIGWMKYLKIIGLICILLGIAFTSIKNGKENNSPD